MTEIASPLPAGYVCRDDAHAAATTGFLVLDGYGNRPIYMLLIQFKSVAGRSLGGGKILIISEITPKGQDCTNTLILFSRGSRPCSVSNHRFGSPARASC